MGTLSDLALKRIHTGSSQRNFGLFIAGESYVAGSGSKYPTTVRSLKAEFDPRSGGSSLTIDIDDSLEGLEGAPVLMTLGYGRYKTDYFKGTLEEPSGFKVGKAVAYGPFRMMAEQSLGERVTYQGTTVGAIFRDLISRAGYGYGKAEVRGLEDFPIAKLDYTEETKLLEVGKNVAEPVSAVFYDRPGGKRTAMPIPKPGTTGKVKAIYQESNYTLGGFAVEDNREGHFSKVVVFRRNSSGGTVIREEVKVPQRGRYQALKNAIRYLPEYPGNATKAKQDAYALAQRLAYGEKKFQLSGAWINPELDPWDAILVESTERRRKRDVNGRIQKPGKWLVTYHCVINDGLSCDISKDSHHMTLSGSAVQVGMLKVSDPIILSNVNALSGGIVTTRPREGSKPNIGRKPRRALRKPQAGLKPKLDRKPRRGDKPRRTHFVQS